MPGRPATPAPPAASRASRRSAPEPPVAQPGDDKHPNWGAGAELNTANGKEPDRPHKDAESGLPLEMRLPSGTWLPLMVMSRNVKVGVRNGQPIWEKRFSNYLQVAHRLVWFREDHRLGRIETRMEVHDRQAKLCLFRAWIFDANDRCLGTAVKQESASDFGDYIEKAETGAVGRALALCGYGTQFAPELDEEQRIVDSPQPAANAQHNPAPVPPKTSEAPGAPPPPKNPSRESGAAPASDETIAEATGKPITTEPIRASQVTLERACALAVLKLGVTFTPGKRTAQEFTAMRIAVGRSLGIDMKPMSQWTESDALAVVEHLEDLPDRQADPHGLWGDGDEKPAPVAPPAERKPAQNVPKDADELAADEKRLVDAAVLAGMWTAADRVIILPSTVVSHLQLKADRYPAAMVARQPKETVDWIVYELGQVQK